MPVTAARSPEHGSGGSEPGAREAGEVRWFRGLRHLDRRATLVAGRPEELLEERVRHAIGVVVRGDDQEVDRAHVAAGRDRRTQDEERPAHELASHLGDEQARVRKVDQLAKQVCGVERPAARLTERRLADSGQPVDVRDASLPDQVLHAESRTSCSEAAVPDPRRSDRWGGPAPGRDDGCPGGERHEARTAFPARKPEGRVRTATLHPLASPYDTASLRRPSVLGRVGP